MGFRKGTSMASKEIVGRVKTAIQNMREQTATATVEDAFLGGTLLISKTDAGITIGTKGISENPNQLDVSEYLHGITQAVLAIRS